MIWELTAIHIAALMGAALVLIVAAFHDAHQYRIPNILSVVLIGLFPVFVATAPRAMEWDQNVMVFLLLLIAGMAMFFGNLAGAGDVKLLAATGLWAGPHLVAVLLITTALAGGVLAVIMVVLTTIRNRIRPATEALPLARVPIPYGVAIATGGLAMIYHLSSSLLFTS